MARKRPPRTIPEAAFPFRVIIPVASYRKFPDPNQPGLNHHTGYIPALCYPDTGFPNDINIRPPNIDRQIYRQIAESLRNIDCTPNLYHLKSKGELHVATHVRELNANESKKWLEDNVRQYIPDDTAFAEFERKYKLIEVLYEEGCSIIDGGHTDRIWSDPENLTAVRETFTAAEEGTKKNLNHLAVEWLVGVKPEWIPEVSVGRRTSLQVQDMTLANHEGKFQWLKDLLADQPYASLIAYRENEEKSKKPIDIRDVIALIAPFNRDLFTLHDEAGKKLPLIALTSKKALLDTYIDDMDEKKGTKTFTKLVPIVTDILELHDLIHTEAVKAYNQKTGGRGGRLSFVDHRDGNKGDKEHAFLFTGRTGPDKLADGALYPILGAFASRVVLSPDGEFVWNTPGGFAGVKKIWAAAAGGLMEATAELNESLAYSSTAVGKSVYHWKNLYRDVALQGLFS